MGPGSKKIAQYVNIPDMSHHIDQPEEYYLPILKLILYALILSILIVFLTAGCARVKPWQREYLADPIMQFDYNKEEKAVREHFLSTREGSTGTFGASGGGCGCN